jgi:hypothetical protein
MIYETEWGPMTDEAPTVPGYYWMPYNNFVRQAGGVLIVWFYPRGREMVIIENGNVYDWEPGMRRSIAPIPYPMEVRNED